MSYSHMYELALRHGEPEWRAALFPLSVDGMIVGASMTLLSDACHGRNGGLLPWVLLIMGSGASLAVNVAVADPTLWSRIIHAWPSFALIGAYELLMREFRTAARSVRTASADEGQAQFGAGQAEARGESAVRIGENGAREHGRLRVVPTAPKTDGPGALGSAGRTKSELPGIQVKAWRWALQYQCEDGVLPSGKEIGARFGRQERWGRLVKRRGLQGCFEGALPLADVQDAPVMSSTVWR